MPRKQLTPESTRLKIGFVLDDSLDKPSGVQQAVLAEGEWLRGQGHEVHYLVSTSSRHDVKNIHNFARNIRMHFNGNEVGMPTLASRRHVRHFLKQEQFDVLHVQMPFSPLLAGRIINNCAQQTAVVGTFHIVPVSWLVSFASRLLALVCLLSLRRFDAVMSVSTSAQAFAWSAFRLKSRVVPNAIALEKYRTAMPYPTPKRRAIHILFLGRLVQRKGCMLLLQAAVILKANKKLPPFQIIICGSGPLSGRLKQFVVSHGLENEVVFKGFVAEADKPRYYASADITVFPSIGGESFGISLIEAMAKGNSAVLGGNNVGYREILANCPGDVLFDPQNATVLAEKLQALLLNIDQRHTIAQWQSQHVRHFDIDLVGPEILDIYNSALRLRRNMR